MIETETEFLMLCIDFKNMLSIAAALALLEVVRAVHLVQLEGGGMCTKSR